MMDIYTLVSLLALPLLLITLVVLFILYRRKTVHPSFEPYIRRAIGIVYELTEEQLKQGNPLYAVQKQALVDLTYDKVLPAHLRGQITREVWANMVEIGYQDVIRTWDTVADKLRDEFAEWEASEE